MGKGQHFRRGFKTEVNDYAREFRAEMGLSPSDPLCPWSLAEHLAIPVDPLSSYAGKIPEAVQYYTDKDPQSFSAITIFDGYRRRVIHNDSHHPRRQASNIAHELSHGILGHMPMPVLDKHGCRYFNKKQEDEANWLGPALLISEEAALYIVKMEMSIDEVVNLYHVSKDLAKMRINVTGAKKRVARIKTCRSRGNLR